MAAASSYRTFASCAEMAGYGQGAPWDLAHIQWNGMPGTPYKERRKPSGRSQDFVPLCGKNNSICLRYEGPPLWTFKNLGSTPLLPAPPDILTPVNGDRAQIQRLPLFGTHSSRAPAVCQTPLPGCASAVPHANGSNPSLPPLLLLSCSGHARRTASPQ